MKECENEWLTQVEPMELSGYLPGYSCHFWHCTQSNYKNKTKQNKAMKETVHALSFKAEPSPTPPLPWSTIRTGPGCL